MTIGLHHDVAQVAMIACIGVCCSGLSDTGFASSTANDSPVLRDYLGHWTTNLCPLDSTEMVLPVQLPVVWSAAML